MNAYKLTKPPVIVTDHWKYKGNVEIHIGPADVFGETLDGFPSKEVKPVECGEVQLTFDRIDEWTRVVDTPCIIGDTVYRVTGHYQCCDSFCVLLDDPMDARNYRLFQKYERLAKNTTSKPLRKRYANRARKYLGRARKEKVAA
jgi:hypothetical protein